MRSESSRQLRFNLQNLLTVTSVDSRPHPPPYAPLLVGRPEIDRDVSCWPVRIAQLEVELGPLTREGVVYVELL